MLPTTAKSTFEAKKRAKQSIEQKQAHEAVAQTKKQTKSNSLIDTLNEITSVVAQASLHTKEGFFGISEAEQKELREGCEDLKGAVGNTLGIITDQFPAQLLKQDGHIPLIARREFTSEILSHSDLVLYKFALEIVAAAKSEATDSVDDVEKLIARKLDDRNDILGIILSSIPSRLKTFHGLERILRDKNLTQDIESELITNLDAKINAIQAEIDTCNAELATNDNPETRNKLTTLQTELEIAKAEKICKLHDFNDFIATIRTAGGYTAYPAEALLFYLQHIQDLQEYLENFIGHFESSLKLTYVEKLKACLDLLELEKERINYVFKHIGQDQNPKIPVLSYLWRDICEKIPEINQVRLVINGKAQTLKEFAGEIVDIERIEKLDQTESFPALPTDTSSISDKNIAKLAGHRYAERYFATPEFSQTALRAKMQAHIKTSTQSTALNEIGVEERVIRPELSETLNHLKSQIEAQLNKHEEGEVLHNLRAILSPIIDKITSYDDLEDIAKQVIISLIEIHTHLHHSHDQDRLDTLATFFYVTTDDVFFGKRKITLREKSAFPLTLHEITSETGWLNTLLENLHTEKKASHTTPLNASKLATYAHEISSIIKSKYDKLLLLASEDKATNLKQLFTATRIKAEEALRVIAKLQTANATLQKICTENASLITQLRENQTALELKLDSAKDIISSIDTKSAAATGDAATLAPNFTLMQQSLNSLDSAIQAQRELILKVGIYLEERSSSLQKNVIDLQQKIVALSKQPILEELNLKQIELSVLLEKGLTDDADLLRLENLQNEIALLKEQNPAIAELDVEIKSLQQELKTALTEKEKVSKLLAESKDILIDEASVASVNNTTTNIENMHSALTACEASLDTLTANLTATKPLIENAAAEIKSAREYLSAMQRLTLQLDSNNTAIAARSEEIRAGLKQLKTISIQIADFARVGEVIATELIADQESEKITLRRILALLEIIRHINANPKNTAAEKLKKIAILEALSTLSNRSGDLTTAWNNAKTAAKMTRTFKGKIATIFTKTASTKIIDSIDSDQRSLAELRAEFEAMNKFGVSNISDIRTANEIHSATNQTDALSKNKSERQKRLGTLISNITVNRAISTSLLSGCDLMSNLLHCDLVLTTKSTNDEKTAADPTSISSKSKLAVAQIADDLTDTAATVKYRAAEAAALKSIATGSPMSGLLKLLLTEAQEAWRNPNKREEAHEKFLALSQKKLLEFQEITDKFQAFLDNIDKLAVAAKNFQVELSQLEKDCKKLEKQENATDFSKHEGETSQVARDKILTQTIQDLNNRYLVAQLNLLTKIKAIQNDINHDLFASSSMKDRIVQFIRDSLVKDSKLEPWFIQKNQDCLMRCQNGWDSFKQTIDTIIKDLTTELSKTIPELSADKLSDPTFMHELISKFSVATEISEPTPTTAMTREALGGPVPGASAIPTDFDTAPVTDRPLKGAALPEEALATKTEVEAESSGHNHGLLSGFGVVATICYSYIVDIFSFLGDLFF